MSRREHEGTSGFEMLEATSFDALVQQQASDSHTLVRAKELLCELWKQGRIDANLRFNGESILAAALHAIENPDVRKLTRADGDRLSTAQWLREHEASNVKF